MVTKARTELHTCRDFEAASEHSPEIVADDFGECVRCGSIEFLFAVGSIDSNLQCGRCAANPGCVYFAVRSGHGACRLPGRFMCEEWLRDTACAPVSADPPGPPPPAAGRPPAGPPATAPLGLWLRGVATSVGDPSPGPENASTGTPGGSKRHSHDGPSPAQPVSWVPDPTRRLCPGCGNPRTPELAGPPGSWTCRGGHRGTGWPEMKSGLHAPEASPEPLRDLFGETVQPVINPKRRYLPVHATSESKPLKPEPTWISSDEIRELELSKIRAKLNVGGLTVVLVAQRSADRVIGRVEITFREALVLAYIMQAFPDAQLTALSIEDTHGS